MKKVLILVVAMLANTHCFAQRAIKNNSNAWLMYLGNHKFSEKWGINLEAQLRRNDFLAKPQQVILRSGINYHFNTQVFASVGYCYVNTSAYGVYPAKSAFPENRLWEQLQFKNQFKNIEIVSRYRLEQRYSNLPVKVGATNEYEPGNAVFTNRFRSLYRASIPFKGKTIVDKSLYFTCLDELMINFGKNVGQNIFDQNRAYVALGYKIPNIGRLEIGYLNQLIIKSDGVKVENNHNFQIGLISTIDFYQNK